MNEHFDNGYGIPKDEYDELAILLYGYEEYDLYKNKKYYSSYKNVCNIIDNIGNYPENIRNAVNGWMLSYRYLQRIFPSNSLQISITDNCQLMCKHCYNQNFKREDRNINLDDILFFEDKLKKCEVYFKKNKNILKNVSITGGEPTLNPYVEDICNYYDKNNYHISMLSNGIDIQDELISKFKTYRHFDIQISIDGIGNIHDYIRGKGTFSKSVDTIKRLTSSGIIVTIAFTANSYNYKEFPKVVKFFQSYDNIRLIWADRYACEPSFNLNPLNKDESITFFNDVERMSNLENVRDRRMLMRNRNRPCSVGHSIIIDAHGNLKACGRLNIKIANLYDDSVDSIVKKFKLFNIKFRNAPVKCFGCKKLNICFGGSCCVSYAENKCSNIEDPACEYIRFNEK